eukprot:15461290-Alexandrium_andersonii.AAC.1
MPRVEKLAALGGWVPATGCLPITGCELQGESQLVEASTAAARASRLEFTGPAPSRRRPNLGSCAWRCPV